MHNKRDKRSSLYGGIKTKDAFYLLSFALDKGKKLVSEKELAAALIQSCFFRKKACIGDKGGRE